MTFGKTEEKKKAMLHLSRLETKLADSDRGSKMSNGPMNSCTKDKRKAAPEVTVESSKKILGSASEVFERAVDEKNKSRSLP